MAEERAGFEIGSDFYPIVNMDEWQQGDFKFVRLMTGQSPQAWLEERDPIDGLSVLLAIAVHHVHRDWSRQKVVEFVDGLPIDGYTPVGMVNADPPKQEAVASATSTASSEGSGNSPEDAS